MPHRGVGLEADPPLLRCGSGFSPTGLELQPGAFRTINDIRREPGL